MLENVVVTDVPVLAGFGDTFVSATLGGRSSTAAFVAAEPDPAAFVAVMIIEKVCVWAFPVDAKA